MQQMQWASRASRASCPINRDLMLCLGSSHVCIMQCTCSAHCVQVWQWRRSLSGRQNWHNESTSCPYMGSKLPCAKVDEFHAVRSVWSVCICGTLMPACGLMARMTCWKLSAFLLSVFPVDLQSRFLCQSLASHGGANKWIKINTHTPTHVYRYVCVYVM